MDNFKIKMFDELEPLYPDTNINDGYDTYSVSCAKNTYAGVHILLNNLTPGEPISFSVKGPHKKFKFFELIPVPVEVNSGLETRSELIDNKYNPYVIRKAPFMIYEALKPIFNICNVKYSTMAFAFRCKVETEELLKYDLFQITVKHCGVEKTINLEVESFNLKVDEANKNSYPYINWLSDKAISTAHNVPVWSKEWEILLERYLKLAHYGRQNMLCIWPGWCFDVNEENLPILNERKLKRLVEIADNSGIYWLCGGTLGCRKDGDWDATLGEVGLTKHPIPGEGEKVLEKMYSDLYSFIQKHNLNERWIQSFLDEPLDGLKEVYKIGTDILKKAMPGIPILDASIARETIAGTLNIWCPTVDKYEKYKEFFIERKKQGDKVFVYTCLNPAGNFCNRQLDVERLRQVYIGWAPAKYDVDGFLHWGANQFAGINPFEVSSVGFGSPTNLNSVNYELEYSQILPPGDITIMYPGYYTPLSSTRLEAHRIGFEDLSLLKKAKMKDEKKTLELIDLLFRRYDDFEKDVSTYRKVKRQLLHFLIE